MGKTIKQNNPSLKRKGQVYMTGGPRPKKPEAGPHKVDYTVLLTCEFVLTYKMFKKYARASFYSMHNGFTTKVLILAVITAFAGIGILFIPFAIRFGGFVLLMFAAYFVFMAFFGYLPSAQSQYMNLREFYGGVVNMKVEFYHEFFRVVTEKGTNDFPYASVKQRIELDDMGVLIAANEGMIEHGQIIDKSVFTPEQLAKYYDILEEAGLNDYN